MAHDSNARRSDDPYRDAPRQAAGGQGSDPLAELARLIGQDDPFADLSKRRAQGAPGFAPGPAAGPQQDAGQGAPDWLAREQAGRGRADEGAYAHQAGGQGPQDPYDQQYDPRYADPSYAVDPRHAGAEDHQGAYAADGSQNPEYGYEQDPYYGDGQPPQDGGYDQPPPEKRRGGLMTIAVVVALAVFGTAAAFGYRAWTGPSKSGEPPVIKAEQGPSKTVPAQPGTADVTRQAYDRPSDRGGERIVSREEQPTDVRPSRPVTPGVVSSGPPNVLPPLPSQANQTGAVPPAAGEPKRVKTVTIRPDSAGAPMMAPTPAPAPAAPSSQPLPQSRLAPPQGATPVQTIPMRPTTPPPAPAPQTSSRSIAEPTAGGGYVVQVSSQRSEAEAEASYRALQAKYPTVLGNRRASIKRADLGERGVYYRAQVGPFGSADEAGAMCSSLKEAGGQCVVQRN